MSHRNRWLVLAVVSSALFLIVIDMTVLYTALPTLTLELAATATEKLWIVNAYPLVVAGLLPGLGTLGDRLGHKLMFMTGLAVFGIASLGNGDTLGQIERGNCRIDIGHHVAQHAIGDVGGHRDLARQSLAFDFIGTKCLLKARDLTERNRCRRL